MMPFDLRRHGTPVASMIVAVAIACSSPTEVCGCSPPVPTVIVVGTVTDAAGAPVAGARVMFDGVSPAMSVDPPLRDEFGMITDAEGAFSGRGHSRDGQAGELTLRAGVVEAGTTDTLRFRLGVARFRTSSPFDTIRVALTIP